MARVPVPCGLHATVYRLSGGLVGSRLPILGPRILLLTTRGNKTGMPRTTPVAYIREAEQLVIIASNRGEGRYPSWYWNLQFEPQATIQVGRKKLRVYAKEARPDERPLFWRRMCDGLLVLELYQQRTPRELPIIVLSPCE